jgi:hypothetical protein
MLRPPPPKPCLASAESAKTAAARISAAHVDTLFNIGSLLMNWNFVYSFNANEAALVPMVTLKKKRQVRPCMSNYIGLLRHIVLLARHVVACASKAFSVGGLSAQSTLKPRGKR